MTKKISGRTKAEYQAIGKLIEDMYLANSPNRKGILFFNFYRGLIYGFGLFLGGTVVVGLLVWFLGLFDQVPLIERLVQNIINNLQ